MIRRRDQVVGLQSSEQFLSEGRSQAFPSVGYQKDGRTVLENHIPHEEIDDFLCGRSGDGLAYSPLCQVVNGYNRMPITRAGEGKRTDQIDSHLLEWSPSLNGTQETSRGLTRPLFGLTVDTGEYETDNLGLHPRPMVSLLNLVRRSRHSQVPSGNVIMARE